MKASQMHVTNINFSDAMQNDLKKVVMIQDDEIQGNKPRDRLNATLISGI